MPTFSHPEASTFVENNTPMKEVDANQLLLGLEQQVESHLAEVVRSYQNWSPEELLRRPGNGGWSAAECLWHLNSYGWHYLPHIEKSLAAATPSVARFRSTWLGTWFTRLMKPGPHMTKMRAFKNHLPPPALDAPAVVAEFIHQQERLLGLLRRAHGVDLNKIKVALSISPWFRMNLGDVFQFLVAHQDRHMVQAARAAAVGQQG